MAELLNTNPVWSGPRSLGLINARFGTPVRVNVFSGIVSTIVVAASIELSNGNAGKYFGAVLGVTISATLISYLLIYPALWKLRLSSPGTPRPFRMPLHRTLTVALIWWLGRKPRAEVAAPPADESLPV